MDTKKLCQNCGKLLGDKAVEGLCPECFLKVGLGSGTAFDAGEPQQPKTDRSVPPTPQELANYFPSLEILDLLGRGGMGAVYKARQKELDRFVALKILPPGIGDDPAFAERFAREAKALAKLNHPGIVTLYEFGRADGLFYFLMEFVDGVNLCQLLQAGRVAPREALAIVPQICDALQYAHDQGIVHRDIKPANILLDRQGRVKVADFGLARLMGIEPATAGAVGGNGTSTSVTLTESGKIMGTPQYMAPEQKGRPLEVDHRADIYSLGVVLYQMLTGELPGKPIEVPSKKVHLDVRLDEVVLRALEKKPERRYQQVSEMKTAVESLSTSEAQAAPREPAGIKPALASSLEKPSVGSRGAPWQIWVVVAMLALEGIGNLFAIPRQPQAVGWLLAKILFVTGLLRGWRPVFILVLLVSGVHVVYFAVYDSNPMGAVMNFVLILMVASAFRFYFPKNRAKENPMNKPLIIGLTVGLVCLVSGISVWLTLHRGSPTQLSQEGWQLWRGGRPAEAIQKFEAAVRLDPKDANAWNGLGWASFNSGKTAEAEKAFKKVIELEPEHPAALNGLGQIYLSQKKYSEAETYFLKAGPKASAAWFGLARLYLLQGKFEQAEKWAQMLVDSGEANESARAMLRDAKAKKLSDGLRMMIEPQ